jgi:hypothetical protein
MNFDLQGFYQSNPPDKKDLAWPEMRVDHAALVGLVERFAVRTILEIGTWRGYTALLLCSIPQVERVHALDVHAGMPVEYRHKSHPLSDPEEYGVRARISPKYSIEFCDSTTRMPLPNEQLGYDMVFIDGNHEYKHVRSDTKLAKYLAKKLIVWHDYPTEMGVKRAVEESGMLVVKVFGSLIGYSIVRQGGI